MGVPKAAERALASCSDSLFPELETTCLVEAAARAAGEKRNDLAEAACEAVESAQWREECHFRAGEEFGRRSELVHAVSHCARAGQYSRFCLTHLGWYQPPSPDIDPSNATSTGEALDLYLGRVAGGLQYGTPAFAQQAREVLITSFWFNVYFGRGDASPAAARSAEGHSGASARWAWATEVVRRLVPREGPTPPDVVEQALAVWRGDQTLDVTPPLDLRHRHGRFHPPLPTRLPEPVREMQTYGGNRRLVAPEPDDDLVVALLEALYFHPEVPAEVFLPFIEHASREVRWTAARLIRVTPSDQLDHDQVLTRLAAHADSGIAAHGREGLRFREWERFTGKPRPR